MISMQMEKVTPKMAAEYLKKNTNNYRKLSRMKVNMYANDMAAGRWEANGEAIVFGEDGMLKDGQHRLAAIMTSGKTVEIAVIRGIDNKVSIYDVGSNRTLANIVNAGGVDLPRRAVAAAKLIVSNFTHNYAKAAVVDYAAKNSSELARACRLTGSSNKGLSAKASCCLATYVLLRADEIPEYEIEVFFRIFNSGNVIGADGYEPSPALVARRVFEQWQNRPVDQTVQKEQAEIIILALRDFHRKVSRQKNYQIGSSMQIDVLLKNLEDDEKHHANG